MATITVLMHSSKDVLIGTTGGAIAYLFDYLKARKNKKKEFTFMVSSLVVNMILGAFVAYLVGSMLDSDLGSRDALIGLSGVTAYNIILLAESRFAEWVMDKFVGKK